MKKKAKRKFNSNKILESNILNIEKENPRSLLFIGRAKNMNFRSDPLFYK